MDAESQNSNLTADVNISANSTQTQMPNVNSNPPNPNAVEGKAEVVTEKKSRFRVKNVNPSDDHNTTKANIEDEKPPIQENLTAKSNDEIAEKPIAPKKSRFTVKTVVKEDDKNSEINPELSYSSDNTKAHFQYGNVPDGLMLDAHSRLQRLENLVEQNTQMLNKILEVMMTSPSPRVEKSSTRMSSNDISKLNPPKTTDDEKISNRSKSGSDPQAIVQQATNQEGSDTNKPTTSTQPINSNSINQLSSLTNSSVTTSPSTSTINTMVQSTTTTNSIPPTNPNQTKNYEKDSNVGKLFHCVNEIKKEIESYSKTKKEMLLEIQILREKCTVLEEKIVTEQNRSSNLEERLEKSKLKCRSVTDQVDSLMMTVENLTLSLESKQAQLNSLIGNNGMISQNDPISSQSNSGKEDRTVSMSSEISGQMLSLSNNPTVMTSTNVTQRTSVTSPQTIINNAGLVPHVNSNSNLNALASNPNASSKSVMTNSTHGNIPNPSFNSSSTPNFNQPANWNINQPQGFYSPNSSYPNQFMNTWQPSPLLPSTVTPIMNQGMIMSSGKDDMTKVNSNFNDNFDSNLSHNSNATMNPIAPFTINTHTSSMTLKDNSNNNDEKSLGSGNINSNDSINLFDN